MIVNLSHARVHSILSWLRFNDAMVLSHRNRFYSVHLALTSDVMLLRPRITLHYSAPKSKETSPYCRFKWMVETTDQSWTGVFSLLFLVPNAGGCGFNDSHTRMSYTRWIQVLNSCSINKVERMAHLSPWTLTDSARYRQRQLRPHSVLRFHC